MECTLALLSDSAETGAHTEYRRIRIAAEIALSQSRPADDAEKQNDAEHGASAIDLCHALSPKDAMSPKDAVSAKDAGQGVAPMSAAPESGGAAESTTWVCDVQAQLRLCVTRSMAHGCVFLALLAAVDWLCFEMDLSSKLAGDEVDKGDSTPPSPVTPPVTPSLLEAMAATKDAIGENFSKVSSLLELNMWNGCGGDI